MKWSLLVNCLLQALNIFRTENSAAFKKIIMYLAVKVFSSNANDKEHIYLL